MKKLKPESSVSLRQSLRKRGKPPKTIRTQDGSSYDSFDQHLKEHHDSLYSSNLPPCPSPSKLTEYESRRLEKIKRNKEMLACLQVHSKVDEFSSAIRTYKYLSISQKANILLLLLKESSEVVQGESN